MNYKKEFSIEYRIWQSIKQRVFPGPNKYSKYEDIGMEESWKIDFKAFLKDVGIRPSENHKLIRKDQNRGFYTYNCEWSDKPININNSKYFLTYNNKTQTIKEWSEELGICYWTLIARKRYGWTDEKILSTPVKNK